MSSRRWLTYSLPPTSHCNQPAICSCYTRSIAGSVAKVRVDEEGAAPAQYVQYFTPRPSFKPCSARTLGANPVRGNIKYLVS
eukprot:scaffold143369_cov133-Phaeocystis_antarctica.AAC.1